MNWIICTEKCKNGKPGRCLNNKQIDWFIVILFPFALIWNRFISDAREKKLVQRKMPQSRCGKKAARITSSDFSICLVYLLSAKCWNDKKQISRLQRNWRYCVTKLNQIRFNIYAPNVKTVFKKKYRMRPNKVDKYLLIFSNKIAFEFDL